MAAITVKGLTPAATEPPLRAPSQLVARCRRFLRSLAALSKTRYWLLTRALWVALAFVILFVIDGLLIGWSAAYEVLIGITSPADAGSAPALDELATEADLVDEAGAPTASSHTLRHTFGTNLLRQGVDIVVAAELLGHTRLDTTRRYTLPTHGDLEAAVAKLPTGQ